MVTLKGSLLNLFIAELKVNKIATDPHRHTQTSSLADPAKEEGVIASRY